MATGYTDEYAFDAEDDLTEPMDASISISVPTSAAAFLPPPSQTPTPSSNAVLYITSDRFATLSRHAPVHQDRALLLHALLKATELLSCMAAEQARPATIEQLRQYHEVQYLAALAHPAQFRLKLDNFGLVDDCAPFPGLFEHACLSAGGSLQAAAALVEGRCHAAVHLAGGGRHHARRHRASGFCHVNDCVLAILELLRAFKRVMYLDIDVHHGDAVEEAFQSTNRVLTLSLHHASPGFFPGSGALGVKGEGAGAGFALNLPLGEGLRDGLFFQTIAHLGRDVMQAYRPDCVVLQCGVDGLAHDPIGRAWALTPAAYGCAVAEVSSWGLPLLLLGGGGYDGPAAACAWAAAVAGLLGRTLPEDVPQHEYFDQYGPSFSLKELGKPSLAPDTNDPVALHAACEALLDGLRAAVQTAAGGDSTSGAKEEAGGSKRQRKLGPA